MSLPSSIPLRRDPVPGSGAEDHFPGVAVIAVLLVVAVFAWSWWRGKRRAGSAAGGIGLAAWLGTPAPGPIRRVASIHLTPRHTVHEIEWQGRKLLVGCSEQGVSVLSEAPIADATDRAASP